MANRNSYNETENGGQGSEYSNCKNSVRSSKNSGRNSVRDDSGDSSRNSRGETVR